MSEIIKSFKGRTIRIREDKYVCLTDMADANGKRVSNWVRLTSTDEYLQAFEQATQIRAGELIELENGNATWAHPKIAIRFAQWCSPEFAIQVDFWIDELMTTGSVSLQPSIPAYLENVQIAQSLTEINDSLSWNPRLAQFLIDQTIDRYFGRKVLSGEDLPIKGVAEIAESMGLAVNHKNRSALGRYIASLGTHEQLKEDRICNGQIRQINCYRVTDGIKSDVAAFFS